MEDNEVKNMLELFHKNQLNASRKGMRLGFNDIKEQVQRHDRTLYGKNGKNGLVSQVGKNKSSIGWLKWVVGGALLLGVSIFGIFVGTF